MPYRSLAIIALLCTGLALKVGFVGMAVWLNLTFPNFMQRAFDAYQTRVRRCVLLGTLNFIAIIVVGLILLKTKVLGLVGLVVLAMLMSMIVAGYAVAYRDIGMRLGESSASKSNARLVLLGGIAAEAAFLAPILGQVFSLAVLFRGLGAVVISVLSRSTPPQA